MKCAHVPIDVISSCCTCNIWRSAATADRQGQYRVSAACNLGSQPQREVDSKHETRVSACGKKRCLFSGCCSGNSQRAGLPRHRVTNRLYPIPQPCAPSAGASIGGQVSGERSLTVGRPQELENHPLLPEAFARPGIPDAKLMILSAGDSSAVLTLGTQLGMSDRSVLPSCHRDPSPF